MKVWRNAAVSALALAMLAGCGGSDSDDDTTAAPEPSSAATSTSTPGKEPGTSGTATGKPGATAKPSAGATSAADPENPAGVGADVLREAKALAAAGVLVAADLPGYTNEPLVPGAAEEAAEDELYRCLRLAKPTLVARNPGRHWVKGPVEISSSADVFKSATVAKQYINGSKSGLAPGCFDQSLQTRFAPSGTSVVSQHNGVPVTVSGAAAAFAVKFTYTVTGTQDPKKYAGYLLGAVVDAVRVTILYVHTDGTEPTLAEVSKQAGVAVAHAKAAQKN